MNDKKTLNIDPDLFSFSSNTTRKKRTPSAQSGGIKIKPVSPKKKNDSLKKKSILKMIRQHQEDRYKNLFDAKSTSPPSQTTQNITDNFNKEFKEATLFFENLTEKTDQQNKMKNYTVKQYPTVQPNSLLFHPTAVPVMDNNIKLEFPTESKNTTMPASVPTYGCLKGGYLPTYRSIMNSTQKNRPISTSSPSTIFGNIPLTNINNMQSGGQSSTPDLVDTNTNTNINRIETIKQTADKIQELNKKERPKINKRKKTLRRTYKIGKSKVFPRVSVLVSNKTIRNNISTTTQLLKQTPIQDVKKYLMQHGFIKVGSIAPNDVLRKMYESATLICGEVHNHNPDNLLYNYFNGNDTK